MSIEITKADITFPEDTTITDTVIKDSTIWIRYESTLTLGSGSRIDTCKVYAPRGADSKPAIFIDGGAMVRSHLDTLPRPFGRENE